MKETMNRQLSLMPNLEGEFKIEVINEDGTVAQELEVKNVVKQKLIDEADISYQKARLSLSPYDAISRAALLQDYPHFYAPISGIALLNDAFGNSDQEARAYEGDMIGWFDIGEDNPSGSTVYRGNRVLNDCKMEINDETGMIETTIVGEFNTNQANGTINKIGFMAYGARYIGAHDIENSAAEHFMTQNYALIGGPSSNSNSQEYAQTMICTNKEAAYSTNRDDSTIGWPLNFFDASVDPAGDVIKSRTGAGTTCAGGRVFVTGHASKTSDVVAIEIYNLTESKEHKYDTSIHSFNPIYSSLPTGDFTYADGILVLAFDCINEILYILKLKNGATDIPVFPLSHQGGGVWSMGTSFSITHAVDLHVTEYAAASIDRSGKLHLAYLNSSKTTVTHVRCSISPTAGTAENAFVFTLPHLDQTEIRDIVAYSDTQIALYFSQVDGASAFDRNGTSSATNGSGVGGLFIDIQLDRFSYCFGYSGNSSIQGDSPSERFNGRQNPIFHGQNPMDNYSGLDYKFPMFDGYTRNFIVLKGILEFDNDTGIFMFIYPYTPTSDMNLITSAVFGDITKSGTQTLRVSYVLKQPMPARDLTLPGA